MQDYEPINYMDAMLFRRRNPLPFAVKLREFLWPRKGFARPFRYVGKRILRLTATPHAIAAGVVAGVIASWTPFIGLHFLLAFALAYILAGNMVAAALGTAFGNPLTFPFIWAVTWEVGHRILGHGDPGTRHINLEHLFSTTGLANLWQPFLKPMLVGAIPLAAISSLVLYVVIYHAVAAFQGRRRQRLAERARERLSKAFEGSSV